MKIIKNTSKYDTKKLRQLFCFIHFLIAKKEDPHIADKKIKSKKTFDKNGFFYFLLLGFGKFTVS